MPASENNFKCLLLEADRTAFDFFFSSCFSHYHDHPSSALTTHKEWGKKLSGSCDSINSIHFLSRMQYSPFDIIYNASFLKHQGFTGTELKSSNANQAPFYAPFY